MTDLRNKTFWYVVFAVICITVFGVLFITLNNNITERTIENPYLADDYYTISEYQGKIAVFDNKSRLPLNIFDTYVSTLPQHDRMLLEEGIKVQSTEELQKIIEDYTS